MTVKGKGARILTEEKYSLLPGGGSFFDILFSFRKLADGRTFKPCFRIFAGYVEHIQRSLKTAFGTPLFTKTDVYTHFPKGHLS